MKLKLIKEMSNEIKDDIQTIRIKHINLSINMTDNFKNRFFLTEIENIIEEEKFLDKNNNIIIDEMIKDLEQWIKSNEEDLKELQQDQQEDLKNKNAYNEEIKEDKKTIERIKELKKMFIKYKGHILINNFDKELEKRTLKFYS